MIDGALYLGLRRDDKDMQLKKKEVSECTTLRHDDIGVPRAKVNVPTPGKAHRLFSAQKVTQMTQTGYQ